MNIKRNIIFTLERRKNNNVLVTDNVPIRMRVIYGGTRIDFSTGYRIDTLKWEADKQRVKNGCTNKLKQSSSEINADLLKYYTDIQEIFKAFEVADATPTPEQLKSTFNKKFRKDISNEAEPQISKASFMNVFEKFLKECGTQNNWTDATYKKFAALKTHLTKFNSNLTFEELNDSGLIEFVNYLRDKKDMRNSSIGKQISLIKWFLRWGLKKGHHNNNAFESFNTKLKNSQKKVIFLTWDELNKLRNYKIPATKQYLERVRDVFLFTCFTGLRYSDVFNQ